MTFTRPAPRVKQMDDYTPKPKTVVLRRDPPATMCVPLPKEKPWRCEAYLRIVAHYPCAHCGIEGRSQAAHADEGKGLGIKASDATAIPLCADSPGRRGCHTLIGNFGLFTRDQRRTLEKRYAQQTRERIKADGLWKPEWPEFEQEQAA